MVVVPLLCFAVLCCAARPNRLVVSHPSRPQDRLCPGPSRRVGAALVIIIVVSVPRAVPGATPPRFVQFSACWLCVTLGSDPPARPSVRPFRLPCPHACCLAYLCPGTPYPAPDSATRLFGGSRALRAHPGAGVECGRLGGVGQLDVLSS